MQWYEYFIIAVALIIVAIPVILHFVNKKKGKSPCGCDCSCCSMCDKCHVGYKPDCIEKIIID